MVGKALMTVYRVVSWSASNSVLKGRSTHVFCGTQCHFPLPILHCPGVQKSKPALIHSEISAGQTNVPSVKYFRVKGIIQMQEVLQTNLNTEITNARDF